MLLAGHFFCNSCSWSSLSALTEMTPECILVPRREKMQDYDHNCSLSPKKSALKAEIFPWTLLHTLHTFKMSFLVLAALSLSHTHTRAYTHAYTHTRARTHTLSFPVQTSFQHSSAVFFPSKGCDFPILTPSGWLSTYEVSPSVVSHSQRQLSR